MKKNLGVLLAERKKLQQFLDGDPGDTKPHNRKKAKRDPRRRKK